MTQLGCLSEQQEYIISHKQEIISKLFVHCSVYVSGLWR